MSANITLEEKFEAHMKIYQAISSSNQELEKQNKYLQDQIEDVTKQAKKAQGLKLVLPTQTTVRKEVKLAIL